MVSSVVERLPYKQMVTGSNPVPPILKIKRPCKKISSYTAFLFIFYYSRIILSFELTQLRATAIATRTNAPAARLNVKLTKLGDIFILF